MSDLLILVVGYFIVNILSFIIAARVRKHLNASYARLTHVFVLFVAAYYCVDVILLHHAIRDNIYFYFWISIILTQALILILSGRRVKIEKQKETDKDYTLT